MPLEGLWRSVLTEAAHAKLHRLSAAEWDWVLESEKVKRTSNAIQQAGQYGNWTSPHSSCVSNSGIRVRPAELLKQAHIR